MRIRNNVSAHWLLMLGHSACSVLYIFIAANECGMFKNLQPIFGLEWGNSR